jgi:hypothetical protein
VGRSGGDPPLAPATIVGLTNLDTKQRPTVRHGFCTSDPSRFCFRDGSEGGDDRLLPVPRNEDIQAQRKTRFYHIGGAQVTTLLPVLSNSPSHYQAKAEHAVTASDAKEDHETPLDRP